MKRENYPLGDLTPDFPDWIAIAILMAFVGVFFFAIGFSVCRFAICA